MKKVAISNKGVFVADEKLNYKSIDNQLLIDLYRGENVNYPKFFKMDGLCKLGFLASELLLKKVSVNFEKAAITIFSSSSSIYSDERFIESAWGGDEFCPSPSIFVYTLPNILAGEIAIKNKIFGETECYLINSFSAKRMIELASLAFLDEEVNENICIFADYFSEKRFSAMGFVLARDFSESRIASEIEAYYENFVKL